MSPYINAGSGAVSMLDKLMGATGTMSFASQGSPTAPGLTPPPMSGGQAVPRRGPMGASGTAAGYLDAPMAEAAAMPSYQRNMGRAPRGQSAPAGIPVQYDGRQLKLSDYIARM